MVFQIIIEISGETSLKQKPQVHRRQSGFVENVVGEDYSMLAFNVEDYELDENENGTIKILYMPSNAGNGATKVNLTIVKSDSTYQIEYALLAGVYEADMSTVSNQ